MGFQLRIEDGSYVQTLEVRTGALTVGRNPPGGLALTSPGLSTRHAIFRQAGDRVEVEALATKIGVRLRGERIDLALLAPNETILVGWAKITVVEITPDTSPGGATEPAASCASAIEPVPIAEAARALAPTTTDAPLRLELEDAPSPWKPAASPAPVAASRRSSAPTAVAVPAAATILEATAPKALRTEPVAEYVVLSRQAVRVLPWWGISVALHALLLAYVVMLPRPDRSAAFQADSTFAVTLRAPPPSIEVERSPVLEPNRQRVDVQRPDMAVPMDTPDSTLPASNRPKGKDGTGAPGAADPEITFDDPVGGSPWAQPGGSSAIGVGAGARIGSGVGSNLDQTFGKGDASRANATAAGQLNGDPFTRALVSGLRLRTNAQNVKVVKGDYDQGELVMDALGLRHGWFTGDDLARGIPGQDVRAIFYTCTGRPAPARAAANVERWVSEGGYLFSSDWGIEIIVEKAFPGYIKSLKDGPRTVMTPDETITFTIAPGKHPLLSGLPPEAETARWWLEDSSIPFVIENKAAVEVLVQSAELDRKYRSKLVAVTFPYGKGRVVHVLGHMYQKEGNLRGAYAMQRLLLNFLYQAIRQ